MGEGVYRIKNVAAISGEGFLIIGVNPVSVNLHVKAGKYINDMCEILDLTCKDCEFVPLTVLKVENYEIKSINYLTGNLIYRVLVLPDQIEYTRSALKTLKAQGFCSFLENDIFTETEEIVSTIHTSRNSYINDALSFYNRFIKRSLIRRQLEKESLIVSESSLEALRELELIED